MSIIYTLIQYHRINAYIYTEGDKEPKHKTLNLNLCTVMPCVACTVAFAFLGPSASSRTLLVVAKKILFSVVT